MALRLAELGVDNIKLDHGREFIGWLKVFKFFNLKRIHIIANSIDLFGVKIYTQANVYGFRITKTYLGCTAASMVPRPGEDWNRGNDLPDGKFERDTMDRILGAILFYEAQEIVGPKEPSLTATKTLDTEDELPPLG